MWSRKLYVGLLVGLAALVASCSLIDGDSPSESAPSPNTSDVSQPVFLQPTFVLDGLDELPNGIRLSELHLGLGSIFLDLVEESETGIAYANRSPFQLHFYIKDDQIHAAGPPMELPHGGLYQVSIQLSPQPLLTAPVNELVTAVTPSVDQASAIISGFITETTYPLDGDPREEPAPLPWYPDDVPDMSTLRRNTTRIPFTFATNTTVRFVVGQVQLEGGSRTEMIMQLQVGDWVEETIKPALRNALRRNHINPTGDDPLENEDINLNNDLEEVDDGVDGLVGGIDVDTREL